jgi:hypothetical protein
MSAWAYTFESLLDTSIIAEIYSVLANSPGRQFEKSFRCLKKSVFEVPSHSVTIWLFIWAPEISRDIAVYREVSMDDTYQLSLNFRF